MTPWTGISRNEYLKSKLEKQAGTLKFNEDQINWLRMIKDYVATSFHLEIDDLDYTPVDVFGGRGRMYQLLGDEMNMFISELNEALAAWIWKLIMVGWKVG
jgi:type I restriction enzyme, R subunit